jgi:alpha-amylase
MKSKLVVILVLCASCGSLVGPTTVRANPWNGKVVLQAFHWDCLNRRYRTEDDGTGGWYTYLAKLAPRLRDLGFDGIWVPPPCKGNSGRAGMGYDLYDHYDIGQKFQKGTTATRFGSQDDFLRLIAVAHASGLEVYPDIVLNHMSGGDFDAAAAGDDKNKTFQYTGFSGVKQGRWPKSWLDFHPNPNHSAADDEWRKELFGPDICYRGRCCDMNCDVAGSYMRDNARQWFVWFKKQTDVDGFRFDAVKHFPPEVVEDLLFNAMDAGKNEADQRQYFAVGEFPAGRSEQNRLDDWASQARNRSGTFDFAFREALTDLVGAGGFFDMGSLPNYQQGNRFKTVPFVNNHDTWRGVFSDSSGNGAGNHTGNLKNGDELVVTLDPDGGWARVVYAAIMAIDGSPQVYYEDLFRNIGTFRDNADPQADLPLRDYIANLVWCHQKLNFKDGAYKVRFQQSQDLLVIERSAKAVIGLNDNGNDSQTAQIQTDFGPNVDLHDYSGATTVNIKTDGQGKLSVTVPAKSYAVWGPTGIGGGFAGHPRRTMQEFQLDNDLGDADPKSPGYGGRVVAGQFRTAGSVWCARETSVRVWVYADQPRNLEVQVLKPDSAGKRAADQGQHSAQGMSDREAPLFLSFATDREGFFQVRARLVNAGDTSLRTWIKVEYEAPATTDKF